jgi:hypothetical protein
VNQAIEQKRFTDTLMLLLDETFNVHHGIFLNKNTSLFETLDSIGPEVASRPVGRCATLAAQVAHVTLYLDVLESYVLGKPVGKVDWDEIWRTIGSVSPAEWDRLRRNLKQTHGRVMGTLQGLNSWDDDKVIGGTLAIVAHTAYHLGAIRQALCILR